MSPDGACIPCVLWYTVPMVKRVLKVGGIVVGCLLMLYLVFTSGWASGAYRQKQNDHQNKQQASSDTQQLTPLDTSSLYALYVQTNSTRLGVGLSSLQVSSGLINAARVRCEDMVENHYYSHTTTNGSPWYLTVQEFVTYKNAGENLAAYYSTFNSVNVFADWMNSPEHRDNILFASYTNIGLASCEGVYQNKPTVFVVEEFDD